MILRSRGRRTPPSLIYAQVGTPQCPIPDDETVLAEAQTMYVRVFIGDVISYYTKDRWIGSLKAGSIHLSNHNTALCEAIWLAYQDLIHEEGEEARHARLPSFASEAEMVTALLGILHQEGWVCQTEHLTPYGRADMLATMQGRQVLIEVKLATDGNTLKAALGQLLAYGLAMPEAELWIAVSKAVPPRFLPLFHHYHITIREVPCLKIAME